MHRFFRTLPVAALVAALLLAASPGRATAQPREDGRGGRTTLVTLPEHFPASDAVSLLLRTPDRDVVVLRPEELTVEGLVMALSVLARLEERTPSPGTGQVVPVTGYSLLTPPSDAERSRLQAALTRLERAPLVRIGDLGPGRWIELER